MKRPSYQRPVDDADLHTTIIEIAGINLTNPATYKPGKKYRNGTLIRNITLTNTIVI